MKTLMTTAAIAAFLAVSPALAQDAPLVDQPAATEPIAPGAEAPAEAPAATEPMLPDTGASPDTATAPTATDEEVFIAEQASEEGLVSNWVGEAIYNASDENLGSVDDLLLTEDGQIKAVVVGVGGFLGIGKKSVAIAIDAIEPRTDENGDLSLYVTASAEQLDGAPTFKTQAELLAEARAREQMEALPDSGLGTGPAVPTN